MIFLVIGSKSLTFSKNLIFPILNFPYFRKTAFLA